MIAAKDEDVSPVSRSRPCADTNDSVLIARDLLFKERNTARHDINLSRFRFSRCRFAVSLSLVGVNYKRRGWDRCADNSIGAIRFNKLTILRFSALSRAEFIIAPACIIIHPRARGIRNPESGIRQYALRIRPARRPMPGTRDGDRLTNKGLPLFIRHSRRKPNTKRSLRFP